ncbi:nucleoporin Nup85-like protein [Globomyces pollinis-pini]|nr:nucleoporin Nup85-like protein [Globomyces pollinis-pini]
MENDYPKAIALCTNLDWWLTTHLIDLLIKLDIPINLQLNHNGKLLLEHDKTNGKSITNLTEWYLINFAESLLIHDQLWKDALDYLVSCPNVDLAAIESIISRIPLTYQSNIDHLLQFCDAHSLHQSKKSILKILGKQCMDRKDYIPSIKYFVSAGDYFHVSLIVDMILTSYIQTGSFDFPTASLLPIPNEAQWRRLTFLIRFDQFQGYLKFKQYELAAKEIIPLFNSEIIPNFFFNTFLVDILPLLEGDFCLFSSVELIDLMRCLESFTVKNQMDNMDSSKNMLNLVRLALTRSLSSAYAVER